MSLLSVWISFAQFMFSACLLLCFKVIIASFPSPCGSSFAFCKINAHDRTKVYIYQIQIICSVVYFFIYLINKKNWHLSIKIEVFYCYSFLYIFFIREQVIWIPYILTLFLYSWSLRIVSHQKQKQLCAVNPILNTRAWVN